MNSCAAATSRGSPLRARTATSCSRAASTSRAISRKSVRTARTSTSSPRFACRPKLLPGIAADLGQAFDLLDLERITPLQRDVLIEKQLISRNFIQNPQHRIAFITADRATSIMVNEEDHLRIQCMAPRARPRHAFARASHIDDMVESQVDIAFDEKMGYLTSCPTNLGTGLRASVLHLPGLVFTRNIQSIMNISPQLGLAITQCLRRRDGERRQSVRDLQNQLTLGFSEQEILENLKTAVMEIVSHERQARKALALYMKERLELKSGAPTARCATRLPRRRKCSSSCRRCASASTSKAHQRGCAGLLREILIGNPGAICKAPRRERGELIEKMKSTGCGPSMCAMPCSPTPGVRRLQNGLSQSLHEPRHQGD